jgi:prepilin signal peptidase PulO-like enzyme (type II secretory pathway)
MMGIIFASMWYSMIMLDIDLISMKSLFLIFFGFVTGTYILYDLRYMEIPDQIMVPAIVILFATAVWSLLFWEVNEYTFHTFHISIIDRIYSAWILYTFFYMQVLIPGGIFLIQRKYYRHLRQLFMSYITFPFRLIWDFFWKKNQTQEDHEDQDIEIPTWIGGGDIRIAIFIGLTLGTLHGIASFVFAYILGSIVGIWILIINRLKGKPTNSQIPFWPFLGMGWILSVVLYIPIVYFYTLFYV